MKYTDSADLKSTMRSHGICVVIPTYNNAGTLRRVVSETLQYCDDVIVVNDGSTDSTSDILASISGIDIVSYSDNQGKGTALKRGFMRALERGFSYAVTIDSDGQHYPENIEDFVKAVIENPGSLIVGQRDLSNVDINGKSSFANKFSNFWFCVQTGRNLKDTQTGYRAYPLRKLYGLSLLTSRYEAELELLVFAAWNGVDIKSIPIKVYYPPRSERISHFRPALDFTRISVLNTILCVGAVAYGLPMRGWNTFRQRKLFRKEFKPFTRKKKTKREASLTLSRVCRSLYSVSHFLFWAFAVFKPMTFFMFAFGTPSEKKRLKLHRRIQRLSRFFSTHFPGAPTDYRNPAGENFSKPAVVVCNHQSHLDLPVILAINPKLIFLTNDWVWNNRYFGNIIHRAEYMPVSAGVDSILPQLRDLRDRGYSIVIFPEGTRSEDCSILRFHQGAFHLADRLELDIVPMVLHGAGDFLPKKDFMLRRGEITLSILDRVSHDSRNPDLLFRKEASSYRRLIMEEYAKIAAEKEKFDYFRPLVSYKYAYRGWDIVARSKKTLKKIAADTGIIDNESPEVRNVRILNSGIGVFAIVYALVNKNVEVYAFEYDIRNHSIAVDTAGLPSNLHLIHTVWNSDFDVPGVHFDKTIILDSEGAVMKSVGGLSDL